MLGPDEWTAVRLSLGVGLWSCALVVVPGILLGWLFARARFPGKLLLEALVHLPLVVTPVVVGYGLLLVFGRHGPLGGLGLAFSYPGAVLAAAVVALPLVVRSVRTAIEMIDPGLEQAAAVLGAGPLRRFLGVTLPLALPGVIAGLVLGFARSLGEFGATITFAGSMPGTTTTLPIAIHTATQVPGGDATAGRLTLISIALSLLALAGSEWTVRRLRCREPGPAR